MNRICLFLLLIVSLSASAQTPLKTKFVIEKGKFIFDKFSYLKHKQQKDEVIKQLKELDSLQKLNDGRHYTHIDDRVLKYPKLINNGSVHWVTRLINKISLSESTKKGENIFCILINKEGKPIRFYADKIVDKDIFKQVKKLFSTDEFSNWDPAAFFGIEVNYIFRFKIIIDDHLDQYDLKNKWARPEDSNLSDFKET